MKAYFPYLSIAGVCVVTWIIIKFGTGILPSYPLPQVETIPLPDRILEIEMWAKKPSLPIRIKTFLGPKISTSRKGPVSRALNKKVHQKRFLLQAIIVDGERRFASIDGYSIVGEGDSLDEFTVLAIGADSVRLKGPVGEEVLVFEDVQTGEEKRRERQ